MADRRAADDEQHAGNDREAEQQLARIERRRTMSGSMNAINTDISAMHVAPTEAFESLIEP